MADEQELLRLADEVAAATGPNRRLDYWIMARTAPIGRGYLWDPEDQDHRYTASLDAAVSLLPADAVWSVNSDGESATGSVYRRRPDGSFIAHAGAVVEAATPAVALVACALRARAHSTKDI